MKDNIFFDTSVLVYSFDYTEHEKRELSKKYVESVFEGKNKGIVSNQVLAELFNVLTRHVASPLIDILSQLKVGRFPCIL